MLPQLSYVYEEKLPRLPLTSLIGLEAEESHLLSFLGYRAKSVAPLVGQALATRIQAFSNLNASHPLGSRDTQLYLQDWFLQLFQCREEKFVGFQEYFLHVPLNLVLMGIDVILTYGTEITQSSPDPEGAARAFYKSLALKITSEQLQSQADEAEHYYEMMLLD